MDLQVVTSSTILLIILTGLLIVGRRQELKREKEQTQVTIIDKGITVNYEPYVKLKYKNVTKVIISKELFNKHEIGDNVSVSYLFMEGSRIDSLIL